jgi:hypothetical protein
MNVGGISKCSLVGEVSAVTNVCKYQSSVEMGPNVIYSIIWEVAPPSLDCNAMTESRS